MSFIKTIQASLLIAPLFLTANLHEPCPENNLSTESNSCECPESNKQEEQRYTQPNTEQEQSESPKVKALSQSEREVYYSLGTTYRKIYLHALNNEERRRVVVLVRRGHDPHVAINSILRSEHRKQMRAEKKRKRLSPAARSIVENKRHYHVY